MILRLLFKLVAYEKECRIFISPPRTLPLVGGVVVFDYGRAHRPAPDI